MKVVWSVVAAVLLGASVTSVTGREWMSSDGATLKATFISSDGKVVVLKRSSDGRRFTLPLSRLSGNDQEWVEKRIAETSTSQPAAEPEPITGQYATRITGEWKLSRFSKLPYAIFGGDQLDGAKKYPLLLALHDKSSNNTNGVQVPGWAKVFAESENYAKHPCIIVAPLCYQPFGKSGSGWDGEPPALETLRLIKDMVKDLPIVDPDRVYVFGHSMGGLGVNYMVSAEPDLFAAAIGVAGCSPESARAFRKVPYLLFHAADDEVVDVETSREMADKLERSKSFKYTEFKTGGHGIAERVFDTPGVRNWLFEQSK